MSAGDGRQATEPEKIVFCSIATTSYLAQALACLNSIRRYQGQARYALLLIADDPSSMEMPQGIDLVQLVDCVPIDKLERMQALYGPAELCFAVKPFLINGLMTDDVEQVHYFDSDCLAFGSVDKLIEELSDSSILLTPHTLTPIPDDGRTIHPLTVLKAGSFNAGYIGVRNSDEARSFIVWWSAMTSSYAKNAPREGMCGDQKWLNLAPIFFPHVAICRLPGANVGYWNLHERELAVDADGRYRANGRPLIFFHFSGYEIDRPTQLSKHQNRHLLEPDTPLHALVSEYRLSVFSSTGKYPQQPSMRSRFRKLLQLQR